MPRCARARLPVLAAAVLVLAAAGALAAPAAAQPSASPPAVIDGPSGDIVSLNGLSVARDGTGGVIYVNAVGGVPRVFVSGLVEGQFQAPVQIDPGLGAASSQPVIAAGNGGVLLIAFINGGTLYVAQRARATARYGAPAPLAAGAANPSLEMSNLGKAYLAFAVADGSGHDVRAAFWANRRWRLEAAPLNALAAADDAGTGAGAPHVATAGDGVGIVAWGEGGHIYSRRVWGTAPSVVDEQADVPSLSGCGEVSAGSPAVAAGGDSSYADVAFQEVFACGAVRQARVLLNRLHGSRYDGVTGADGLSTPGAEGAGDPNVAMAEYGQGFVTAQTQTSNSVRAMVLGNNGASGGVLQINSQPGTSPPDPVPAIAGLVSHLVAWQQDPGSTGPPEIRVRYDPRGSALGPEQVLSVPARGPTDAGRGLFGAGDIGGDAAIAWVQGTGASTQIIVERLYQAPSSAVPPNALAYVRTAEPVLRWSIPGARWGPITYTVTLDGLTVGQTAGAAIQVTTPLGDGPHTWRVTSSNPAGLSSVSRTARVFVDTVAPRLSAVLAVAKQARPDLTLRLSYRDVAPGSGVASLTVRWGDRTVTRLKPGTHRATHVYRGAGTYRITIVIADQAGNQTTIVRGVKIAKPKAKASGGGTPP